MVVGKHEFSPSERYRDRLYAPEILGTTNWLSNIRLYAKGSNLFTFSKFDLWDPEVDTSVGTKYPIMKSFSAGFDINF